MQRIWKEMIESWSEHYLPGQTEETHGKPYGSQCLRRELNEAPA